MSSASLVSIDKYAFTRGKPASPAPARRPWGKLVVDKDRYPEISDLPCSFMRKGVGRHALPSVSIGDCGQLLRRNCVRAATPGSLQRGGCVLSRFAQSAK